MNESELKHYVEALGREALEASRRLAVADAQTKNRVLELLAGKIESASLSLRAANEKDLTAAEANGLTSAMIDRLRLSEQRITQMAEGVRQVAALPDPVGEEVERLNPPNGLDIRKVRVPIGVIGIIYESRPNVTIDCAALCLKSGNAAVLRGGKEAFHSNQALAALVNDALEEGGLPRASVQLVDTTDRAALGFLLKLDTYLHCIIPRGGEGLIRYVAEASTVPVIKHYKGVCNLYIDREADWDTAEAITINAKCQRPGVCNAIENLLVDRAVAPRLLPRLADALQAEGVKLLGCAETRGMIEAGPASEDDYSTEYLDKILSIKVVENVGEAIEFINRFGSAHSDAIVTENEEAARRFLSGVDTSTVYWNASTRFTDGFEFGLGAEIGISTDRLHARGPMGLRELCTYKYLVYGKGEVK